MDGYLTDSVQIQAPGTASRLGQPAWGAAVTVPAWVEQYRRMIWTPQGQQTYTESKVILGPTVVIAEGYLVTHNGRSGLVQAVSPERGLEGVSHIVAYLGPVGPTS